MHRLEFWMFLAHSWADCAARTVAPCACLIKYVGDEVPTLQWLSRWWITLRLVMCLWPMQPTFVCNGVSAAEHVQHELFAVSHWMPYYSHCSFDHVSFPYCFVYLRVGFCHAAVSVVVYSYVNGSPGFPALCSCIRQMWWSFQNGRLHLRECDGHLVVFVYFFPYSIPACMVCTVFSYDSTLIRHCCLAGFEVSQTTIQELFLQFDEWIGRQLTLVSLYFQVPSTRNLWRTLEEIVRNV